MNVSFIRRLLASACLGTLFFSHGSAVSQPAAPALVLTPPEVLLRLICDYCIAASDISIERKDGTKKPLSRLDLKSGVNFHNVEIWHLNKKSQFMKPPYSDHNPNVAGDYIEWKPEYAVLFRPQPLRAGEHNGIPVLVPVKDSVKSWRDLIATEHVCLGSRFWVATYYFKGHDGKPLQNPPVQGTPSQGGHASELPSTPHQTICEGELRPIKTVLATFVEEKTNAAVSDFTKEYSGESLEKKVMREVVAWLNANRASLAAEGAGLAKTQGTTPP